MYLAQDEPTGSPVLPLLMIVGLFAIFYFMLIRPNRRRRQQMESLQSNLAVGDEVMTSSGLYGTVAELDEKSVILETSEGVYSRYARGAIADVVTSSEPTAESELEANPETTPETSADPVERRDSKD